MNTAKLVLARVKQFAEDHKVAIAIIATAVVTTVLVAKLQKGALAECHEFIDSRGLGEDFINSVIEKAAI